MTDLHSGGENEIIYKRYPDFPPDPAFNITLDEGWNLISLPFEQRDEAITEVLSSIDGKWDCVRAYDPLAPEPWKSYSTFKPGQLNDLQFLNHRMGFWINITEPGGVNLTVSGPIPDTTSIPLYAGWNLVGYPSFVNDTLANRLWGTGADAVLVSDLSKPYHIKEVGPTYSMKPCEGYWIHVPSDSVWIVNQTSDSPPQIIAKDIWTVPASPVNNTVAQIYARIWNQGLGHALVEVNVYHNETSTLIGSETVLMPGISEAIVVVDWLATPEGAQTIFISAFPLPPIYDPYIMDNYDYAIVIVQP